MTDDELDRRRHDLELTRDDLEESLAELLEQATPGALLHRSTAALADTAAQLPQALATAPPVVSAAAQLRGLPAPLRQALPAAALLAVAVLLWRRRH